MYASVRSSFVGITEPLEGRVDHFYADVRGLVTIAYGVLVDPVSIATSLPMLRADGTPATSAEIVTDWQFVKGECCEQYADSSKCAWRGSGRACMAHDGHREAAKITRLRLSAEGVEAVTLRKLDQVNKQLVTRFPAFESWPADAQLATLSLAWACGAGFRFPRLDAALRRRDFAVAALECKIAVDRGTIKKRNVMNAQCYRNAALVVAAHLEPSKLYWPMSISDETPTLPDLSEASEAPTLPELPAVESGIREPDGGASRHRATLDVVADTARRRYD